MYVLACLFCQFGVGSLYSILVSLATQVQTKENIISSKVSLFSNKMTKKNISHYWNGNILIEKWLKYEN
jgi:hypothetical protein